MKLLNGDINVNSDIYKKNFDEMHKINVDLNEKLKKILQGGGEKANKKHLAKGKFLGIYIFNSVFMVKMHLCCF
jgi:3-methylcrotonyl-CoA carboxylase beta subunit